MIEATLFFLYGEDGWSERYFKDGSDPTTVLPALVTLAEVRAAMLGKGAIINGLRCSNVDPVRDSVVSAVSYGTDDPAQIKLPAILKGGQNAVEPWTRALMSLTHNPTQKGRVFMGGIPEGQFLENPIRFKGGKEWDSMILGLTNAFKAGGWCFRAQHVDPAQMVRITSYTLPAASDLLVTTAANHGLVPGDPVYIYKGKQTQAANFPLPHGAFRVGAVPSATTYTLAGTGKRYFGLDAQGTALFYSAATAKQRKVTYDYPTILEVIPLRPVSHRTGRPFDSPHGRRRVNA